MLSPTAKSAFTLIELSIVLVILGLLVGGVLTGKSLIRSASIKAQIEQINQYNAAVRTFQAKYLDLPGDMALAKASAFKFYRDGTNGVTNSGCTVSAPHQCGDGDGLIGRTGANNTDDQSTSQVGEAHLFWLDLMKSGLIANSITVYADKDTSSADVKAYLPQGKLASNYLYVWANGVAPRDSSVGSNMDGRNYMTLSGINHFGGYFGDTAASIRVADAYSIDTKTDDGLPQSGNTTAVYIKAMGSNKQALWVGASSWCCGPYAGNYWGGPTTAAVAPSATTCYDNNNTAGQKQRYSLSVGENANCALSFVIK